MTKPELTSLDKVVMALQNNIIQQFKTPNSKSMIKKTLIASYGEAIRRINIEFGTNYITYDFIDLTEEIKNSGQWYLRPLTEPLRG